MEPPEDVDPRELAPEIRSQLRTLSKLTADRVARHLVAAGRLVDDDPAAALQHARAARAIGARVAVVREAVGEAAYAAGEWAEAIAELRTARRMTGDDSTLPLIADSERALGRADRALRIAQSPEALALEPAAKAEMRIVEAGARRDLGQLDAALVTLEESGLDRTKVEPWAPRLWYAYADVLLELGRGEEAREWFVAAASVDQDGATDADERILQLDGVEVLEDEDAEDDEDDNLAEADADPSEPDDGSDEDAVSAAGSPTADPEAAAMDDADPPAAALDGDSATAWSEDADLSAGGSGLAHPVDSGVVVDEGADLLAPDSEPGAPDAGADGTDGPEDGADTEAGFAPGDRVSFSDGPAEKE